MAVVAQALDCSEDSVSNWTHAWQAEGLAGVREGPHPGAARRLDAAAEQRVAGVLASDPQAQGDAATGWTGPLRRTALATGGWMASERKIRRMLHRLGRVWKRPKFVSGRPDPAYGQNRGRWPSK